VLACLPWLSVPAAGYAECSARWRGPNTEVLPGMRTIESNVAVAPVELVVGPRIRPLGGLEVNRVWPTARRRLVGPFIFFDHMQRTVLPPGVGLDVPPHPHIGLATVTYLFEGEICHADSIGCRQVIRPGELNWMSAGRGITHSERTSPDARASTSFVHGIQSWVALPVEEERNAPRFDHFPASSLPLVELPGARIKVIAGAALGARSPVESGFELFYLEVDAQAGATIPIEAALGERAVYIVSGGVRIADAHYDSGRVLVLASGRDISLQVSAPTKLMLFGGPSIGADRHIWWNFVSSDPARIEQAKADWKAQRFAPVPGETEFMPLPE
jgi:redox-sensitive bicupin YhaK (pirin superfamily)